MRRRGLLPPAPGFWSFPRSFEGPQPDDILRCDQPGAAARACYGCQGPVGPGARPLPGWERRAILIGTQSKLVNRRALLASAVAFSGLLAGCTDSNKSDGQIKTAPEATNASDAIAKSYSENMLKKYGDKAKKKP
jgi:hypothetical protein